MGLVFGRWISPDSAKKVYKLRLERRLAGDEACPEEEDRRVHSDGGVHQISNPQSCYRQRLNGWAWVSLVMMLGSVAVNLLMLTFENYRKFQHPPATLWRPECSGDGWRSMFLGPAKLWQSWSECIPGWKGWTLLVMLIFEFFGLLWLLLLVARSTYYACCRRKDGYTRWRNVDALWCDYLPLLGRFSAIKFLGKSHPAFLVLEFRRGIAHILEDADELREASEDHPHDTQFVGRVVSCWTVFKIGSHVMWFFFSRVIVFLCGFAALITKVSIVQDEFEDEKSITYLGVRYLWPIFIGLAFLNQALNTIDISRRLFDRALRFVFAGEDSIFQKHEWNLRLCYKAEVARELHEVFADPPVYEDGTNFGGEGRPYFAIAALVAFGHLDVQRLAFAYVGLEGKNKRPDHLQCDVKGVQFLPKHLIPQYLADCEDAVAEAGSDSSDDGAGSALTADAAADAYSRRQRRLERKCEEAEDGDECAPLLAALPV